MDVAEGLAKIIFVEVHPDLSSLSDTECEALKHCVRAAELTTEIYLRQVSPQNPRWREELQARSDARGRALARYFEINGGPWDMFDEDRPFLGGAGDKAKGAALYPPDLTEQEWDAWLTAHPNDRPQFESSRTVIVRRDEGLAAVPYSEVYADFLRPAAEELRAASSLLSDAKLKRYLELQADAFISNDYWECDLAWIDTDGHPFEVTIGPHEVYLDRLFGVKAAFEAFVALPDEHSTRQLATFLPFVPDFDAMLAEGLRCRPKGPAVPLEVVSDVYRGGEVAFGRQFVAFNLPNDRRIHEFKGSKKVFSRTMMEAKFNRIGSPIAERILKPQDFQRYEFEKRLLSVLGHELAHGLGPGLITVGDREISFEVVLRDLHSLLEEAKADVLGTRLLVYLAERGILQQDDVYGCILTQIVHFVQSWRTGFADAHSAGALIQYNWLKEDKALSYDRTRKVFDLDVRRVLAAMHKLSEEFFRIQLSGNYDEARAFVQRWSSMPAEIPEIIESLSALPYEVYLASNLANLGASDTYRLARR
jgi:hypothetical protein